jgi:hypothetical protein
MDQLVPVQRPPRPDARTTVLDGILTRHREDPYRQVHPTNLVPKHLGQGELKEPVNDPAIRHQGRGMNTLQTNEYEAILYERLNELSAGEPTYLDHEEAMRIGNLNRIAELEIERGLIHGVIEPDWRLQTKRFAWPISDLVRPDPLSFSLDPNGPTTDPGLALFRV